MSTLLVVHHTPSPACQELLQAVLAGAATDELPSPVQVTTRPALAAGPADVLAADAVLLGTPANIGTMSGALKHFLDQIYYPVLQDTADLPYGLWVHGGDDVTGAVRDVLRIAGALGWTQAAAVLETTGTISPDDREAAWELGATLALAALGGD